MKSPIEARESPRGQEKSLVKAHKSLINLGKFSKKESVRLTESI